MMIASITCIFSGDGVMEETKGQRDLGIEERWQVGVPGNLSRALPTTQVGTTPFMDGRAGVNA